MRNGRNNRIGRALAAIASVALVVGLLPSMAFAGTASAEEAGGLAPGAASGIAGEDAGQGAESGMTAAAVVASGICGYYGGELADNLSWTLDDAGVLTISGTGPMNKYSPSDSPWGDSDAVKSVVIKDGVTSIGDYAFYGCKNLASVEMPDSVTGIEDDAFYGCAALASVEIPHSVTYIGGGAFYECSSLTSVVIPGSVGSIATFAFGKCKALERVVISAGVFRIDSDAFSQCKNLKEVAIPSTVTYIGSGAFASCPELVSGSGTVRGGIYFGGTLPQWKSEVNDQGSGLPRDKTSGLHCMPIFTVVALPQGTGRIFSFGEYSFEANKWLYTAQAIILSGYVLKNWTQYGEVVGDQLCWTVAFSDDQVPTKPTVANFEEGVGDVCGVNLMWKLKDDVLTVYGTGEMDYRPYWDGVKDSFSSVEIIGAQNITSDAFNGRNNLESAMITESVTSIGASAFENCTSMSAIAYGGSEAQWGKVKKGSDWDKNTPSDKTITFAKWDVTASASPEAGGTVTGSGVYAKDPAATVTLTATPEAGYRFVNWTEDDGTGNTAVVSTDATYEFTAEDDRTLVANFVKDKHTITFVNEGGGELQKSQVKYGETPKYVGETPTKAADEKYTYTFAGWTPEVVAVTGEATYTATYESTVNKYAVKFVDEDGAVLQSGKVAYGETPKYVGATPAKAADDKYTYTFKGWTPEVAKVTGEATYTATYDKKEKEQGNDNGNENENENGNENEAKPYDGDLSDVAGYVESMKASMPDLDPDSWYMGGDGTRGGYFPGTDVLYLDYTLARGLMGGYTDKDGEVYAFGPNDPLKRAEAVTTLYRMANKDATATTDPAKYEANRSGLPDVEDRAYYTAAVNWAVENGIVIGYTDESGKPYAFGPDDPLLREQVATITWRWCTSDAVGMAQPTEKAADIYDDAASISEWALTGVAFCHEKGIMTGFGGTRDFGPALTTERCEMSKVVAVADRLVRIKLASGAVQSVFGS